MASSPSSPAAPQPLAFVSAFGCYLLWGVLPIYWKLLGHVPAFVVLCHRIAWSLVFSGLIIICMRRMPEVRAALTNPALLARLFLSSLLVGCNWLIYIWAVQQGMILETSLGYFTLPMLNVVLGVLFFGDRPRPLQIVGIACAATGVLIQFIAHGSVPLVALGLAFTFSIYGAIRKGAPVEGIPGMVVETMVLTPLVLIALFIMAQDNPDPFVHGDATTRILLIGAGVVTTTPLIWFAYAARRMSLVTLGLLQYLAPTIAFFIGLFIYHETLNPSMLATFCCIWLALIIYSLEGFRHVRHARIHAVKQQVQAGE